MTYIQRTLYVVHWIILLILILISEFVCFKFFFIKSGIVRDVITYWIALVYEEN